MQYYTSIPAMSSNVLTLVTIFLPLSSLWASKTTKSTPTKQHRPTSPLQSSPLARGLRAKQVFSSSASLLFTESDRVDNRTPVNRTTHGWSVASSLGLAEGHHEVFALQDQEKQGIRWKARRGVRHGGMSNDAVPVLVVESCTHGLRGSTKVKELHTREGGGRKTKMVINPGVRTLANWYLQL